MKKLLLIILLLIFIKPTFSQGTAVTPFDTTGWSLPAGYTPHYYLYYFYLYTNPGGRVNLNYIKIDSLLHALIVDTDSLQMYIVDDTVLVFSDTISGVIQFPGASTDTTIAVIGMLPTDIVVATAVQYPEALGVLVGTDQFTISRAAGGQANLSFNYIWIHKRE